jgi:hypothetical protein
MERLTAYVQSLSPNDRGDRVVGFVVDSPGGDLNEAAKIADFIHRLGLSVAVPNGSECASACFLLFAAAPRRFAGPDAHIGVHRVSHGVGQDDLIDKGWTTVSGEVLAQYGVPPAIIGKMVQTAPDSIEWLTPTDLASMGVLPLANALSAPDDPRGSSKAFQFYSGVDFDGDDRGPWLYDQSIQGCTNACRADGGCNAFTFNTRRRVCILKSGYGTPTRSSEAISALIEGVSLPPPQYQAARIRIEPGIDYPGGDIDETGYRFVTAEECRSLCMNNGQCRGFSYVVPKSWCWLKYQVGAGVSKSNVVSGVKVGG